MTSIALPALKSADTQDLAPLFEALGRIQSEFLDKNKFTEALLNLMILSKDYFSSADLWLQIGFTYTRMSNWANAVSALDTALTIDPRMNHARQLKALALFSLGLRKEACDLIDDVVKVHSSSSGWILRAYIHAHSIRDSSHALRVARDWGRRFMDPLVKKSTPLIVRNRDAEKKLRVAYVTGDFREHSVAFFMLPILQNHNKDNYEIHVYSSGPWDHYTPRMAIHVDFWNDVMDWSDADLWRKIRHDEIDVLVDLSGYTHGHKLPVFGLRAAPVQVTWVGYMLPLGMKAMDYRIVEPSYAPPSHAKFYSEALFQMPYSGAYIPPEYSPFSETLPMERNGYPTLISPNSSAKITNEMLGIWSRILDLRKDARLIIMVKELDSESAAADMLPRVKAAGMPLDRVSVLHQQPLVRFMELGHIADIMLDTSPISGGTTIYHSLWMGLSIVTMDSERAVDSVASKIIRAIEADAEIADSAEGYIDGALRLMDDPARLLKQRLNARNQMENSGYMNYSERTADVEKAFRLMWINYLRKDKKYLDVNVNMDDIFSKFKEKNHGR